MTSPNSAVSCFAPPFRSPFKIELHFLERNREIEKGVCTFLRTAVGEARAPGMDLGTQGAPVVALDARRVVEALQLSMAPNPVARDSALKLLEDWQKSNHRGLVPALLDILGGQLGSPREVRLYAAIMTKNLVGCSWDRNVQGWSRALVEKRGWNEMDDAEKEALKGRLLCLLFPSGALFYRGALGST